MKLDQLQDGAAYSLDVDGKDVVVFASKKIFTDRHGIFTTDTRVAWELRDSRVGIFANRDVVSAIAVAGR